MIERLDHLVLTVKDVEATVAFYCRVLNMQHEVFAEGRHALVFGQQKFNLHQAGREFEPKAQVPTPGSIDLCLITRWSSAEVVKHLAEQGVEIEQGPIARTGAIGPIESVYIRDPDNNLIEMSHYS